MMFFMFCVLLESVFIELFGLMVVFVLVGVIVLVLLRLMVMIWLELFVLNVII